MIKKTESEPRYMFVDPEGVSEILNEQGISEEHPQYNFYKKYILDNLKGTFFVSLEEMKETILNYVPKTASLSLRKKAQKLPKPQVTKEELKRLYVQEAKGIYDEDLMDEIISKFIMTCEDLIEYFEWRLNTESPSKWLRETISENIEDFQVFIDRLQKALSSQEKMITIDQIINTAHHVGRYAEYLVENSDIEFLNELSNLKVSSLNLRKTAEPETMQENFYEPGKSDEWPKGPKKPKQRLPFYNYPDEQGNIINIDPNYSNPMEYESTPGPHSQGPGIFGSLNIKKKAGEQPKPQVTKQELIRLYKQEAKGIYDEELEDEIISKFRMNLEEIVDWLSESFSESKSEGDIQGADQAKGLILELDVAGTPQEKMIAIDRVLNTLHEDGKYVEYLVIGGDYSFLDKLGNIKLEMAGEKPKELYKERMRKAVNSTSPEVLIELAKDEEYDVRWEVAMNSHTPLEALMILAKDKEEDIRKYVKKRLKKLTGSLSMRKKAQSIEYLLKELDKFKITNLGDIRLFIYDIASKVNVSEHLINGLILDNMKRFPHSFIENWKVYVTDEYGLGTFTEKLAHEKIGEALGEWYRSFYKEPVENLAEDLKLGIFGVPWVKVPFFALLQKYTEDEIWNIASGKKTDVTEEEIEQAKEVIQRGIVANRLSMRKTAQDKLTTQDLKRFYDLERKGLLADEFVDDIISKLIYGIQEATKESFTERVVMEKGDQLENAYHFPLSQKIIIIDQIIHLYHMDEMPYIMEESEDPDKVDKVLLDLFYGYQATLDYARLLIKDFKSEGETPTVENILHNLEDSGYSNEKINNRIVKELLESGEIQREKEASNLNMREFEIDPLNQKETLQPDLFSPSPEFMESLRFKKEKSKEEQEGKYKAFQKPFELKREKGLKETIRKNIEEQFIIPQQLKLRFDKIAQTEFKVGDEVEFDTTRYFGATRKSPGGVLKGKGIIKGKAEEGLYDIEIKEVTNIAPDLVNVFKSGFTAPFVLDELKIKKPKKELKKEIPVEEKPKPVEQKVEEVKPKEEIPIEKPKEEEIPSGLRFELEEEEPIVEKKEKIPTEEEPEVAFAPTPTILGEPKEKVEEKPEKPFWQQIVDAVWKEYTKPRTLRKPFGDKSLIMRKKAVITPSELKRVYELELQYRELEQKYNAGTLNKKEFNQFQRIGRKLNDLTDNVIRDLMFFFVDYLDWYEGYPENIRKEQGELQVIEEMKQRREELNNAFDIDSKIIAIDNTINMMHIDFSILAHLKMTYDEYLDRTSEEGLTIEKSKRVDEVWANLIKFLEEQGKFTLRKEASILSHEIQFKNKHEDKIPTYTFVGYQETLKNPVILLNCDLDESTVVAIPEEVETNRSRIKGLPEEQKIVEKLSMRKQAQQDLTSEEEIFVKDFVKQFEHLHNAEEIYENLFNEKPFILDLTKHLEEDLKVLSDRSVLIALAILDQLKKDFEGLTSLRFSGKPKKYKGPVKSILEDITQNIWDASDLTEAKDIVLNRVQNSQIDEEDKQTIIRNVNKIKTLLNLQKYIANSILSYEGMGLKLSMRKVSIEDSTVINRTLKHFKENPNLEKTKENIYNYVLDRYPELSTWEIERLTEIILGILESKVPVTVLGMRKKTEVYIEEFPSQEGSWAIYKGNVYITGDPGKRHATWFDEIDLPSSGEEFDKIVRGYYYDYAFGRESTKPEEKRIVWYGLGDFNEFYDHLDELKTALNFPQDAMVQMIDYINQEIKVLAMRKEKKASTLITKTFNYLKKLFSVPNPILEQLDYPHSWPRKKKKEILNLKEASTVSEPTPNEPLQGQQGAHPEGTTYFQGKDRWVEREPDQGFDIKFPGKVKINRDPWLWGDNPVSEQTMTASLNLGEKIASDPYYDWKKDLVPKYKMRNLYTQEAKGIYDEELMDEIISSFIFSLTNFYGWMGEEDPQAPQVKRLIKILETALIVTPEEKMIAIDRVLNTVHTFGKYVDYLIRNGDVYFLDELSNLKISSSLNLRKASILDYPQKHLDPEMWDLSGDLPKLKEDVKNLIIKRFIDYLREVGLNNPELWCKGFYYTGSTATYRYLKTSDIDIHVEVNWDIYKENNPNKAQDDNEEMRKDLLKVFWNTLNKEKLPGTSHPLTYYILSAKENVLTQGEEAYDILNDKWIVSPQKMPENLDVSDKIKLLQNKAEGIMKKLDEELGKTKRNLIDYKILQELVSSYEGNKEDIQKLIEKKLEDIEQGLKQLQKENEQIHEERNKAFYDGQEPIEEGLSKNWTPGNILFKLIERYRYLDILRKIKHIIKDEQITETETKELEDVLIPKLSMRKFAQNEEEEFHKHRPQTSKQELFRLYKQEVQGIYDEELEDEIISKFIQDLFVLADWETGHPYPFMRPPESGGRNWAQFTLSLISTLERAQTPQEKMIAIDQVMHTSHLYDAYAQHLISEYWEAGSDFWGELYSLKISKALSMRKTSFLTDNVSEIPENWISQDKTNKKLRRTNPPRHDKNDSIVEHNLDPHIDLASLSLRKKAFEGQPKEYHSPSLLLREDYGTPGFPSEPAQNEVPGTVEDDQWGESNKLRKQKVIREQTPSDFNIPFGYEGEEIRQT